MLHVAPCRQDICQNRLGQGLIIHDQYAHGFHSPSISVRFGYLYSVWCTRFASRSAPESKSQANLRPNRAVHELRSAAPAVRNVQSALEGPTQRATFG